MDSCSAHPRATPERSRLSARTVLTLVAVSTWLLLGTDAFPQGFGQRQPRRDTPAQTGGGADGDETAAISGRIVDGRTGQGLDRAGVVAVAREGDDRQYAVQTDQLRRYTLSNLAAGRFTVTVSKPGYVTLAYGQRRPRQPSTPVEIEAGQHLQNLDLVLPSGSVVTGQVVDENGDALTLATVRVLRYVYQQGTRQLVLAGTDRTDDRGQYRVFGLEPGDYLVSASVPRQQLGSGGPVGPRGGRPFGAGGFAQGELGDRAQESLGYAPSYYPGVTNVSAASRVTVGLSAEASGVDFAVRLVPTATVRGVVFRSDGTAAAGVQVMLIPDDGVPTRDSLVGARVQRGGTFEIRNVRPGQYTLRAVTRGGGRGRAPVSASQRLDVDGYDVSGVALVLTPGATLTGSTTFETNRAPPESFARVRLTAAAVRNTPLLGDSEGRIDEDGSFEIRNVAGGLRLIRALGVPDGWTLKEVYRDGQDVTDTPLEFSGGARTDGFRLVFTDQVSQIGGSVRDREGQPLTDFTIVAFPVDDSLWRSQSRHIKATRPNQNGQYQIEGLPPGTYLIAAVDVVQDGEWFDPEFLRRRRSTALPVSLAEGESQDLDLTLNANTP